MEGQYIPEGALGKVWRVLDRCIMFTTVVGSLASVMFIGAMFLCVTCLAAPSGGSMK